VERFRGGLVFKAHRLVYHSTPRSRVIKKKQKKDVPGDDRFYHKFEQAMSFAD